MGKSIELTILYHNARSIYHKLDELYAMILFQKSDLICNVESWLSEDTTYQLLLPDMVCATLVIQCDTMMMRE